MNKITANEARGIYNSFSVSKKGNELLEEIYRKITNESYNHFNYCNVKFCNVCGGGKTRNELFKYITDMLQTDGYTVEEIYSDGYSIELSIYW